MTERLLHAISISKSIYDGVKVPGFRARVLASFERACDCQTGDGDMIAFVNQEIGNGPFNIVIKEKEKFFDWPIGAQVTGDGHTIEITPVSFGCVKIDLSVVDCWDPQPDWNTIHGGKRVQANLAYLEQYAIENAPHGSLVDLWRTELNNSDQWQIEARTCIAGIEQAYSGGEESEYLNWISRLSGLGVGLTPSGDDWLAGWILGLRMCKTDGESKQGQLVYGAAAGRTTKISMAFLRSASFGEVSEHWMRLFSALSNGVYEEVRSAASSVMKFGATSGSDMLAGFLSAVRLYQR